MFYTCHNFTRLIFRWREAMELLLDVGKSTNCWFTDDTMLFTKSEPEMSQLLKYVEKANNKY